MKVIEIQVYGSYKVPFGNPFNARCVMLPTELSDSMRDDVLRKYTDVFYVFNVGDRIVGDFPSFEIYSFDVISEEVPAVC